MSNKLISLADYEAQTRTLNNGARLQTVQIPLKNFQPTLEDTRNKVDAIMHALSIYEQDLCMKLAWRARDLGRQLRSSMGREVDTTIEVNPAIVSVDFGVVWAFRGLDLEELLNSDNIAFIAEYTKIQQNIQRCPLFFSRDVRLRFARNGARDNPN